MKCFTHAARADRSNGQWNGGEHDEPRRAHRSLGFRGVIRGSRMPVAIGEELPVRGLAALAAELKTRILERVEPGQDWAGFSIHLSARGRWCFAFHGKIRREWYGRTFDETLDKLMAWLELDEAQILNLTLGLTEDGRFRDPGGG